MKTNSRGVARRWLALAALAAGISLVAAGCSSSASAGSGSGTTKLTVAETTAPSTLDPQGSSLFGDRFAWQLAYQCLYTTTPAGKVVPELATSYTLSQDRLTYTFKLRSGVKFHNGDSLTSADVVATFQRLAGSKLGIQGELFPTLKNATASSPSTVDFHLTSPDAGFIDNMANPLVWGCAIMDKSTAKLPATALNMNGTGPWKQTMYRPNSQLAFSQYSGYWGTKTASKALDIVYMPSSQSQVNSLQSGKVDLIFPGEPGAKSLATTKGVTVKQVGSDSTIFLQINNLSKPFDNQKVRQALALAFDRQKLADQAYHGAARPSVYVPPEISWAVPIAQLPYSQPDVAKAKALLAEAGYPNGFTTSLMYINAYDPGTNDLVAAMQTQLAAIGITVTLQPLQATAWNDKLLNANYTLSWNAQSYYSNPFQYIQPAPGRQGPVPASLQKLLDAALNAGSQTEYEAALQAVENEEATLVYPTVTLLASNSFVAYNTQLTGVAASSSGSREFLAQVAHK